MNVILLFLCIILSAIVWSIVKEIRAINLRLKDADARAVTTNGELSFLTQRVVMLEEQNDSSDAYAIV